MTETVLRRIEPEANCHRFYCLSVEPNLFGDRSVVVHWGRIGARGRIRIAASGPAADMAGLADRMVARKLRRGYAVISPSSDRPFRSGECHFQ